MVKVAAAALLATANAGAVNIAFTDCGDASTHVKVGDVNPKSIETGTTTAIVSTGSLDEDVTGASYDIKIKAGGVTVTSCNGDASKDLVCKLPLGVGAFTFKALPFPLTAGSFTQNGEVQLSAAVPSSLSTATAHLESTAANGDKLICLDLHTSPGTEVAAPTTVGGAVNIAFTDCGDASTHVKVGDVTPKSIQTGTTTAIVSTGSLDEDVTGASYDIKIKAGGVTVTSCNGDASKDLVCKLPLGVGAFTFKALPFPLTAGSFTQNGEVQLSAAVPSSLSTATAHLESTASNGDKLICLDLHTSPGTEVAAPATVGGAVNIAFTDCGDASTHVKVGDVSPKTIQTGATTAIVSTGSLDEDVTGASYDIKIKAGGVTVTSCNGDASKDLVCKLPLGVGAFTFKALPFPLTAGSFTQNGEVQLSAAVPSSLSTATAHLESTASNGDKLICLDLHTSPAMDVMV